MLCTRSLFLRFSAAAPTSTSRWQPVLTQCCRAASSFKSTVPDDATNTTSKRKQFKQTPIDPKLFQHLERLGLGWVSRKRLRMPKGPLTPPVRIDPKTIPYFQKNRFRQGKRALRQERKRLEREAVNRTRAGLLRPSSSTINSSKSADQREEEAAERKRSPFNVRAKTRLASINRVEAVPPPIPGVPEMAIIGRSNVGKSTLLNAVLGIRSARKLAAVGNRPGVTTSLEFYVLGPRDRPLMVVVDMPGYGFAFANDQKKEEWQKLMLHFLRHPRPSLKRILLLLDARHGFKIQDREFLEELYSTASMEDEQGEGLEQQAQDYYRDEDADRRSRISSSSAASPSPAAVRLPKLQVVLTKCDMVTREDLARRVHILRQQLSEVLPHETRLPIFMVSADKGLGVDELRKDLAALVPAPLMKQIQERAVALAAAAATTQRDNSRRSAPPPPPPPPSRFSPPRPRRY